MKEYMDLSWLIYPWCWCGKRKEELSCVNNNSNGEIISNYINDNTANNITRPSTDANKGIPQNSEDGENAQGDETNLAENGRNASYCEKKNV